MQHNKNKIDIDQVWSLKKNPKTIGLSFIKDKMIPLHNNTHLKDPSLAVVYVACLSNPALKPCSEFQDDMNK